MATASSRMEKVQKNYTRTHRPLRHMRHHPVGAYLADVEQGGGTGPGILKEKGPNQGGDDEGLHPEGVQLGTVRGPEAEPGVVQNGRLGPNEQALHQKIVNVQQVKAVEVEQVQVAGHVHQHIHGLALQGET